MTNADSKILVVVEERHFLSVREAILREASEKGSLLFKYHIIPPTPKSGAARKIGKAENTKAVKELLEHGGLDHVMGLRDTLIDWPQILAAEASVTSKGSLKVLRDAIKDLLESRKLDWLSHAEQEWSKSSIQGATPKVWLSQFGQLNCTRLGKNLLKLLRVVTGQEMREAFSLVPSEAEGWAVLHSFVKDDELGSSSSTMSEILAKLYGEGVAPYNLSNFTQTIGQRVDLIRIYEDGVWSGVELVKRLEAIKKAIEAEKSQTAMLSATAIHFHFCVTSDVGLVAARAAVRNLGLDNVRFFGSSAENHIKFLSDGFDWAVTGEKSNEEIRTLLDAAVKPYAFSFGEMWGAEVDRDIDLCRQLGAQVAKPFLVRRKAAKQSADKSVRREISDEKALEWSLGALGFGSTIVFASSIPKPVIPLMWLNGDVELNGEHVKWKPLFADARRIGAPSSSV